MVRQLISREDLAQRIGVARQTLARWHVEVQKGVRDFPSTYRVGRKAMYDCSEIERWIETRRTRDAGPASPVAA